MSPTVAVPRDISWLKILTEQASAKYMILVSAFWKLIIPDPASAKLIYIASLVKEYVSGFQK
ncbi:hypothetical protein TZ03_12660 [Pseudomonas sp. 10-1B]|nr:hypothetical protein TZ03_12660 [Pseudomonas sp. 10-1B]